MIYKSYNKYYKIIAFAILLLGFILGIVFGSIFNTEVTNEFTDVVTSKFGYMVMLSTWFSFFILSVFILGIYSICNRLEVIANNTNKDIKSKVSKPSIENEVQTKIVTKESKEENKEEKFIWE